MSSNIPKKKNNAISSGTKAITLPTPLIIPSLISEIKIFEQLISVRKVFILLLNKSSKITDVIKSEVQFPTKLTDM